MKVGKTTLCSEIDKALIASFEPGSNGLHNVLVSPMLKWNDWKQTVRQLIRDKDKLQDKIATIAIDTADEAFKLCEKYICNENSVEKIGDIPYGAGYKLLDNEFMAGFRELAFAGYGLFFVSHEKQISDDDNTQIIPAIPNRPYQLINKLVDSIVYLRAIDETNTETGEVESKRYLFFRGNNNFYAGSRFHYIVPKIELSYENLLKAISDAVDAEVAHKGGAATNDSNPYLTLDFDGVMEEAKSIWIKTDDEQKEKIMKILEEEFGKPTKFSDISPDDVEKLNSALSRIREIV